MQLLRYEHILMQLEINNEANRLSQHLYDSVVTTWPAAVYCNVLDKTPTHWIPDLLPPYSL